MQVKIHSLKFNADKKLEQFIEAKVNKLNQFYDDIISADVFLKVDKDQSLENKIAEIKLKISGTTKKEIFQITYDNSKMVIEKMKERFGGSKLFGKEKDDSFKGSIGAIYQTFGKKDVYPSIEEKAAHLLYFTIKNHSFVDGNKRIAAAIFLWYLEMNNYLYNKNGLKRIADNALVGLCLLIAQSDPKERDTVVKVIVNLINTKNM